MNKYRVIANTCFHDFDIGTIVWKTLVPLDEMFGGNEVLTDDSAYWWVVDNDLELIEDA
jgi:hypothetical protein